MNKQNRASLLIALAAGIGYGGWAVYANFEHTPREWIMAGIVQAIYAFISTLSVTHIAQKVCQKYDYGLKGITLGFFASAVIMLVIPLTVHNVVGTPDIWETILPGLIWGTIYLLSFLIALDTKNRKVTAAPSHSKENKA